MCRNINLQSVCPTCNGCISESTNKQLCGEARRKGLGFGRCTRGSRCDEKEFRGEECKGCAQATEARMDELDMRDFAARGLGWRSEKLKARSRTAVHQDDSDDGVSYTW